MDFSVFATAIGTLNLAKAHFTLKEEVRQSAKWPESGGKHSVVAESVALGHLRLHRHEDVGPQLREQESRLRQRYADSEQLEAALQVLRDRHQEAHYTPNDSFRVVLRTETLQAFLGDAAVESVDDEKSVTIFQQVGYKAIDVMTTAVRTERVRRFSK